MKNDLSRYSFVGLILAGAAVLSAIGFRIYRGTFSTEVQVSLGLIILGLTLFVLLDPERVRMWMGGRQARYGSNAVVLTLAFLGIIAVINYVVYQNNKRWDLTEDKTFTLAPETLDTLARLPEPVTARGFFTAATPKDTAEDLLERLRDHSDGKFSFEFIDPNQNPVAAEQAGITQDGSIVLTMGTQNQLVSFASEQELVGGLVRLMSPEVYTVYFLSGHGERNPDDSGEQSYAQLKSTLEGKNYTVKTLNLLTAAQIPEDAKAVVIAGPRQPLDGAELNALEEFVAGGGSLIVLAEPRLLTDFGDREDPLAAYLLENWGIEIGENIIVDMSTPQGFTAVSAGYGPHPITTPIQNNYTLFPSARSVSAAGEAKQGISVTDLVQTAGAPQSWAETDTENLTGDQAQAPRYDEGQDIAGPVSLAMAAENLQAGSRVIVFGDADFAIDANLIQYGNRDLIVNTIDWAVGQENVISLTPKERTSRVMLPPGRVTTWLLYGLSICALPLLAFVGGVAVYIQRRRRG